MKLEKNIKKKSKKCIMVNCSFDLFCFKKSIFVYNLCLIEYKIEIKYNIIILFLLLNFYLIFKKI